MSDLQSQRPLAESERFQEPVKRRDFLGITALGSFLFTGFTMLAGVLRLPMPSVFPETGSRFRIGPPDRFPLGSRTRLAERKVLVVRDAEGVRAMSLICTHLGCITQAQEGGGFICPCHGSRFDDAGAVVQGPAPSRLRYLSVTRAPNGDLMVDADSPVDPETRLAV